MKALVPALAALFILGACQAEKTSEESVMSGVEQAETARLDPAANLAASEKFIAEKKAEAGVTETASGLLYKVEKAGPTTGQRPSAESEVRVHYEGTLPDGKVFDSSYARGEPAVFPVSRLIPAWTEALQLMRPGDSWVIYVKPDLGYGASGAGGDIPPNAALVFKMELIEVLSAPQPN